MQVGASALAYTPFGGEGGPGTPPLAELALLGFASSLPRSVPLSEISLSANAPWLAGGTFVPLTEITITSFAPQIVKSLPQAQISFEAPLGNYLEIRIFPPFLVWPGYSSDGTNITIPIADLPGLSAAEADATTGDWREILQAILRSSWQHEDPIQDWFSKPNTYTLFTKDFYRTTIDSYFQVKFLTDMGAPNVAPEP
jgi:hypothetical protein